MDSNGIAKVLLILAVGASLRSLAAELDPTSLDRRQFLTMAVAAAAAAAANPSLTGNIGTTDRPAGRLFDFEYVVRAYLAPTWWSDRSSYKSTIESRQRYYDANYAEAVTYFRDLKSTMPAESERAEVIRFVAEDEVRSRWEKILEARIYQIENSLAWQMQVPLESVHREVEFYILPNEFIATLGDDGSIGRPYYRTRNGRSVLFKPLGPRFTIRFFKALVDTGWPPLMQIARERFAALTHRLWTETFGTYTSEGEYIPTKRSGQVQAVLSSYLNGLHGFSLSARSASFEFNPFPAATRPRWEGIALQANNYPVCEILLDATRLSQFLNSTAIPVWAHRPPPSGLALQEPNPTPQLSPRRPSAAFTESRSPPLSNNGSATKK